MDMLQQSNGGDTCLGKASLTLATVPPAALENCLVACRFDLASGKTTVSLATTEWVSLLFLDSAVYFTCLEFLIAHQQGRCRGLTLKMLAWQIVTFIELSFGKYQFHSCTAFQHMSVLSKDSSSTSLMIDTSPQLVTATCCRSEDKQYSL